MPTSRKPKSPAQKPRKSNRPGRPAVPTTAPERRARLIEAALRVIARDGLANASTRAVAAAAGMNQAMLHYSFPGKHALLLAVLELIHAQIQELLSGCTAGARSLPDAVEKMARAFWRHVLATPELQRVQYELTLYALVTPGAQSIAKLQYEGYVEALSKALTQAHQGRLNLGGLRHYAGVCVAAMDGLILQHLATGDAAASAARLELMITALQSQTRSLL